MEHPTSAEKVTNNIINANDVIEKSTSYVIDKNKKNHSKVESYRQNLQKKSRQEERNNYKYFLRSSQIKMSKVKVKKVSIVAASPGMNHCSRLVVAFGIFFSFKIDMRCVFTCVSSS